jgi:hypothetical protein
MTARHNMKFPRSRQTLMVGMAAGAMAAGAETMGRSRWRAATSRKKTWRRSVDYRMWARVLGEGQWLLGGRRRL